MVESEAKKTDDAATAPLVLKLTDGLGYASEEVTATRTWIDGEP